MCTDSTYLKLTFLGGFWTFTHPNMVQFCWQYSSKQNHCLKNFWRITFLWKRDEPKVCTFGPSLTPVSHWRWLKSKKNNYGYGKTSAIGVSKYIKLSRFYLLSPFPEKYNYFLHYLRYFWQETGHGSQVIGSESKLDILYFTHTIPGQPPVNKFWFQHFPVLHFRGGGWYFKFQKWKPRKLVCPFLIALFHFETNLIKGFSFFSDNFGWLGNFLQVGLKQKK